MIIIIYFITLITRLIYFGDAPVYSDEITWMVRGKEFLYALIHFNIEYFKTAWWTADYEVKAIGIPNAIINGSFHLLFAGSGKYSLKIFSDIIASRLAVILVNSLVPAYIYFFSSHFWGKKTAFLAAAFYLFNPAIIGIDSLAINDSLLTLFTFSSLFSFIYYAEKKKNSYIPGMLLGLAFLTKPSGILVAVGWGVYWLLDRKREIFLLGLKNALSFLVIVTVLWPASWFAPFYAIFEYVFRQKNLIRIGLPYYYMGKSSIDPGSTFYLFQLYSRLSEIVLIGIPASLLFLRKVPVRKIKIPVSLVVFVVAYFVMVSFSTQKLGLRYILPIVPLVCLFSAGGFVKLGEKLTGNLKKAFWGVTALGIAFPFISFYPDYYFYYNNFVGGVRGAQRYDTVGICASAKPAFEYLDRIGAKGSVYVAGCPAAALYYPGNLTVTNYFEESDYIVIESYFRLQNPDSKVFEHIPEAKFLRNFSVKGAIIAEVYEN